MEKVASRFMFTVKSTSLFCRNTYYLGSSDACLTRKQIAARSA